MRFAFGPFRVEFGGAPRKPLALGMRVPIVRARYEAAQTTDDNTRHWTNADALGPQSANSQSVRQILRKRARYEYANNTYCQGIVLTLAYDIVSGGPRMQVQSDSKELASAMERGWDAWCQAIAYAQILRTAAQAKVRDGESFSMLTSRPVTVGQVSLYPRLIEADLVTSDSTNPLDIDGVILSEDGFPVRYMVLEGHPGDSATYGTQRPVDAANMLHWFRPDRPGQVRGVPEITSALPLFAQLRRFTLATIAAAETAADFAAVLYTDAPPDGADPIEPMDVVELEKRMATTLPAGWKLGQVMAQHPATTYAMFKAELINEIARCVSMPFNVAACNSSSYNYASGRLDHQTYARYIDVERDGLETSMVRPTAQRWYDEARRALPELIAAGAPETMPQTAFMWDGREHVDPLKEAAAQKMRLQSMTATLSGEYAKQGKDWETELRQRARELGMTFEELQAAMRAALFPPPKQLTQGAP